MTKFTKRVTKMTRPPLDAVVFGTAFGHLADLFDIYKTVFVCGGEIPSYKRKNLIYRTDVRSTLSLSNTSIVFVDLDRVKVLDEIGQLLTNAKPDIIVQGKEVIPRGYTENLYRIGYRAVEQSKNFHVWKKVQ